MSAYRPGYYGAGVYLLGTQRSGPINRQETVYVHILGDTARIVADQPGQDW